MCLCHVLSLLNPSDVTDTDDATRENTKSFSDGDGLVEPEAQPDLEAESEIEAEAEPEIEAELEPDLEAEAEVEPEDPVTEALESKAATEPAKEVEDDNISVTIQAEDAITLDVDGDDLLETGKHVKLPDSEADKGCGEAEASAETRQEADSMAEVKDSHKDCKRDDGPKTDATKKDSREALKKAETGDKEKDSGKKGPSSAGAAGQAKRFVFLCQFFKILLPGSRSLKLSIVSSCKIFSHTELLIVPNPCHWFPLICLAIV